MRWSIVILLALAILGCATTQTTQSTIPAGCEASIVYTKLPGFMPNGPMIARVGVSTALATLYVAEPQAGKSAQLIIAAVMPMLYRATLTNSLAATVVDVRVKFSSTDKLLVITTPLLVLFDSLHQAGQTGGLTLTDCDKNVLASLFKNIGLDSGTDPALFN